MIDKRLDRALEVLGKDTVLNMRRALVNQGSGPGSLDSSIESDVIDENNNVATLEISMNSYGAILDEGRGPSRQRGSTGSWFANLKDWVRRKLNITDKQKLDSVTYVIYRKINERGYRPKPFIQKSIEASVNKNEDNITDAAFRILVDDVDAALGKYYKK